MDKKRGLKNVITSIVFKVVILIIAIFSRRFLIAYVGNDVNGLNALYGSIIGFLSVVDLGIGGAIVYCMYKPIVEGDKKTTAALYCLFKKIYLIIGGIVLLGGLLLMPFLRFFAKDYAELNVNLYLTFGLSLAAVVIGYFFTAKMSLFNAYKNDYIATTISSTGIILQHVAQIVVLRYFGSFEAYLLCAIGGVIVQWVLTEIFSGKIYREIIKDRQKLDEETKREVVKNVRAMFLHKIGGVLVNTADSVIISAFIGVVLLGKYSNYTTIMSAMVGVISLFFSPLVSVIGHLYVEETGEALGKYFNFFHTFNFILGTIFFLGYYAIIDNLVVLCFDETMGTELLLDRSIAFVITLNYFIQFMRQSALLFRDATGTFYYDRWKPLVEGGINIVLSIAFVLWFGIVGVIVATIITNLLICHIVEPFVLYKHVLNRSPKRFYFKNYLYFAVFTLSLIALHFCMVQFDSQILSLLANGFIAVGIGLVPACAAGVLNRDFRHYCGVLLKKIKGRLNRRSHPANS